MKKIVSLAPMGAGIVALALASSSALAGTRAESWQNSIEMAKGARCHYPAFYRTYHDAAVYKIFLKAKDSPKPHATLDQAMEIIRTIEELTGGMTQIAYLVGWQSEGHDSEYPAWSRVGPQCRSSFSADPLTSLRKMAAEAQKHGCSVSLHVNMNDAYTNSPLWSAYVAKNAICRRSDGSLRPGGKWGGEQSYLISHAKEWKSGLAQKRISELLTMLPEVKATKSIHIDALFGVASEGDGVSLADDRAAINNIIDFWHEQGVDVTSEFLASVDLVGLIPMFYHLNIDERQKLLWPPDVICGGDGAWNARNRGDYYVRPWEAHHPTAGCIYEEAWGEGHWGDLVAGSIADKRDFARNFFAHTALFVYYNKARPIKHEVDAERYSVIRANGVVASVRMRDRALTVTDRGRVVAAEGDYFLDYPYGGGTILAYSEKGGKRTFALPPEWVEAGEVKVRHFPTGREEIVPVRAGTVAFALEARSSAVIRRR